MQSAGQHPAVQVYVTPSLRLEDGSFPSYFYILLFLLFSVAQTTHYTMVVSWLSFANKVSDPLVASTYVTLFTTFWNLGNLWPRSAALWLVGQITVK